jgi:transcriptional regulator with XRE-family HTH domain
VPKTWDDPLLRKVGVRIRTFRKKRGLSQEALAETVNIDRTYMFGIERGVRNMSLVKLRDLARALKVPLRSFVADE